MENQPKTAERLTRAEIRRQSAVFSELDRDLTEQLAAMFDGGAGEVVSGRDAAARARAKQLLNGHGHILPTMAAAGQTEAEIFIERDAIRLILDALQREDTAVEAIETTEWVIAHAAEWQAIARAWVLAAVSLQKLEARAKSFIDKAAFHAPPGVLALTEYVGRGAEIFVPDASLDITIAAAVAEGVVSQSEIQKAQNAK